MYVGDQIQLSPKADMPYGTKISAKQQKAPTMSSTSIRLRVVLEEIGMLVFLAIARTNTCGCKVKPLGQFALPGPM